MEASSRGGLTDTRLLIPDERNDRKGERYLRVRLHCGLTPPDVLSATYSFASFLSIADRNHGFLSMHVGNNRSNAKITRR